MKVLRFVILTIELAVCYLLQSVVALHLSYTDVVPDLMLVIVISAAFMFGSNAGMVYGFMTGLWMDIVSGGNLGLAAFTCLVIGFLAGLCRKFYRKDDNVTPLLLTAAGEFIYLTVYYFINFTLNGRNEYVFMLKNVMLPRITLTVLIAVFLYKLCQLSIGFTARGEH